MTKSSCFRAGINGFFLGAFTASILVLPVESHAGQTNGTHNAISGAAAVQRDPFWPIGYTPEWVIENASSGQPSVLKGSAGKINWDEAMKRISIQGVSSKAGNEFFAIVNGEVKCVGDTVSLKFNDLNYTWIIESILPPNSVKMRRISAR